MLSLTKGSMSADEYTNAFTDKMKFAQRLVSDKLTKIDRYAKGISWEYIVPVNQTRTFEAIGWAIKSIEEMMKKRTTDKAEADGKKGVERSNNNNDDKKKKYSKRSNEYGRN